MRLKNALYLALGYIGLGLGVVGAVVPLIPAFPFLLLAAFGFARGSERVHAWFLGTRLYKDNLASYVSGKGMTWATKRRVVITLTAVMGFGFLMMSAVPWARWILAVVWVGHVLYFCFGVATRDGDTQGSEAQSPIEGTLDSAREIG